MLLHEAIRLGSMMGRQAFNAMQDDNGTCALGAALEAIGKEPSIFCGMPALFPTCVIETQCPECGRRMIPGILVTATVAGIVIHLNDYHMWTREKIADWVESIEVAAPIPQVLEVVSAT